MTLFCQRSSLIQVIVSPWCHCVTVAVARDSATTSTTADWAAATPTEWAHTRPHWFSYRPIVKYTNCSMNSKIMYEDLITLKCFFTTLSDLSTYYMSHYLEKTLISKVLIIGGQGQLVGISTPPCPSKKCPPGVEAYVLLPPQAKFSQL